MKPHGWLLTFVAISLAVLFFYLAGSAALNRMERRECNEWQHDAIYNPAALRSWQDWQREQCEAHRITVEWPEK